MKVRFLLDENLSPDIVRAVRQHNAQVDIIRVGSSGAPGLGTLDPDILKFCEAQSRLLITDNRKSMPGHIAEHLRSGGHHWRLLNTRRKSVSVGEVVAEILLIWEASEAEEYHDSEGWIPL